MIVWTNIKNNCYDKGTFVGFYALRAQKHWARKSMIDGCKPGNSVKKRHLDNWSEREGAC